MRILIAVHGYPPERQGGAERRAERTARAMRERGHEVAVICVQNDNTAHNDLRYRDRSQDGIGVREIFFNGGANPDNFRWSYDNPELGTAVGAFIDQHKPQLMHLFSGYLLGASALKAATSRRVRTVVDLTDYWWHCHQINLLTPSGKRCDGPSPAKCARCYAERQRRFRLPAQIAPEITSYAWSSLHSASRLGKFFGLPAQEARGARLRTALCSADTLIAPSQFLADFYIRHGAERAKIKVWRQGVALDQCRLRSRSQTLRVGYLGQVKPHKGVDLLLKAWGQLRGPRPRQLAIYGSADGYDDYRAQLEQQIAQLADALWHGSYVGNQVWEVLAQLDVVIVPSRWVENSPNSILEAQAVGVALVGSNLGGIAELIEHERNGLLFQVDDADDLARNLQRLLDEPELLPRLRANVMPFLAHSTVMDRLERLYNELSSTQCIHTGRPLLLHLT
jgi:glycosyltransferase involved in cell wall biosynthesis